MFYDKRAGVALAAVFALGLTAAYPAAAQSAAYDFTAALVSHDSSLSLGFEFTTNSAITINSLGYFDEGNDGFLTSHTVGIFDSTQTLLTSITLAAGTGDPLDNKFRYKAITPLLLEAGKTYTAVATTGGTADGWDYGHAGTTMTGFVTNPSISIDGNGARYLYQADDILRFPTNHFSDYTVYAGPNFKIGEQASNVPEPGALAILIGMGLSGAGFLSRRKLARRVA